MALSQVRDDFQQASQKRVRAPGACLLTLEYRMRKELIERLRDATEGPRMLMNEAATMLEADAQPAVPQEHDLHNAIMNIQATPDKTAGVNFQLAYKMGHRDARHAAAELALASSQQRPRLTDAEIHELLVSEIYPNFAAMVRAVEKKLGLKPCDVGGDDFFSHERKFKGPF